jgi:hypothetical protein
VPNVKADHSAPWPEAARLSAALLAAATAGLVVTARTGCMCGSDCSVVAAAERLAWSAAQLAAGVLT